MELEELIDILCCPKCKGELKLKESKLICEECDSDYLIKDNIIIFLPLPFESQK